MSLKKARNNMAIVKRPNRKGKFLNANINFTHLCLGIFIGAFGMKLWIEDDLSVDSGATGSLLRVSPGDGSTVIKKNERKLDSSSFEEPLSQKSIGWHPVHVFYGEKEGLFNDAPESISKSQESYSQVGQDSIILNLLGSNGYFIDLAANDALDLTNTLALERKGWTGLCIEPNPVYWYGLSHRKCTVVGAMVAGTAMEKVKAKFRGVYGGIMGKYPVKLANRKKEPDAPEVTRYTASITEVLNKFKVPTTIDYLSLDVEGSEYEIMKDFPFETYTIRVLTVERPNKKLKKLFEEKGYVYLAELATWGEYLYCHKSTGFTADHETIKAIKPRT